MKSIFSFSAKWNRAQKSAIVCIIFSIINMTSADDREDVREYCTTDTFEPKCGENELIAMKTASYGRMRLGRCLKIPYDSIGCGDDVLAVFDERCSGSRRCRVSIPDKELHEHSSCKNHQLYSYLEASFSCLRIFQNVPSRCSSSIPQPLSDEFGHIAHTSSPNHKCVWTVRLSQGLRVNVTLLDFETARHGRTEVRYVDCYIYALVREGSVVKTRICSGAERERVVYLSETNSIEIETFPVKVDRSDRTGVSPAGGKTADEEDEAVHASSDGDPVRYILKYEAIGCADLPAISGHMIIVRPEVDKLMISCDNTTKPRYLVCRNGEWNGTVPVCSQHSQQPEPGSGFWSKVTSDWAHAILITVAIGMTLGIVMGVALLTALMAYLKRRDHRHKAVRSQSHQLPAQYYSRSVRTTTEQNNEVQIYYERSRSAFDADVKAPPGGEFLPDSSWLLMGHHHHHATPASAAAAAAAEDVVCSCPDPDGKLLERQAAAGEDNHFVGRKGHQVATEHVYEMTC